MGKKNDISKKDETELEWKKSKLPPIPHLLQEQPALAQVLFPCTQSNAY